MINIRQANKYCKEDISKIENYDKAIADTTQVWHLHHRNEIRTLPLGITIIRTKEDLIDDGRYYGCNANELIFLTNAEHIRLHRKGKSWSEDTRRKISESLKGKKRRPRSEETKKKISESVKKRWASKNKKRITSDYGL